MEKKILGNKIIVGVILSIVAIVLGYLVYLVADYHRIKDNLELESRGRAEFSEPVATETEYSIVTYNIGFGAYDQSYSFFMDGGSKSWARSKEAAINNVNGACDCVISLEPDFVMFQEVDFDSTRTYHLNELGLIDDKLSGFQSTFGVNYDSSFLLYPINEPHGANRAGIGTYSKYSIQSAIRRQLPISNTPAKILDLDRCYTINKIPVSNGKNLVLINLHLTAYGNSPAVRAAQTTMIRNEMANEYAMGNYVIVGGDFNHELKNPKAASASKNGVVYYDRSLLPEHYSFAIDLLEPEEIEALAETCRDAGKPYDPNTTKTSTLDGFIISDNILLESYKSVDTSFAYSDHDPVYMSFKLIN